MKLKKVIAGILCMTLAKHYVPFTEVYAESGKTEGEPTKMTYDSSRRKLWRCIESGSSGV